jgi:recombination protein RecA
MFGSPETTPGGRALKFFCSVRMDVRRIGQIKDNTGKVVGNRTRLKVVKNKVAAPFTECEFDIMYAEGISKTGSIIDLGVENKILDKKGAWLSYDGTLIGQGREAAKQHLADNPDLAKKLHTIILEKVQVAAGSILAGKEEEAEVEEE